MARVRCVRCGREAEGLEAAPLPGPPGRAVAEHSCRSCWEQWRGEQVKLINELKLRPADPEHYALLVERMKAFLQLP